MRKNVRHEKFINAYLKGNNATQSAIIAGYSKKNAKIQGYKLSQREDIKAAIDERMEKQKSEDVADENEILMFYTNVLRRKTVDTVVTPTGKIVKIKPRLQDQIKAADMLGKTKGLFIGRHEVKADFKPVIIDDVIEDDVEDG